MKQISKRKTPDGGSTNVSWPLYCSDMGNSTVRNFGDFSGGSMVKKKKKEPTCNVGDFAGDVGYILDQEDP